MEFLRRLGTRLRARRLKIKRTRVVVAAEVEISVTQLVIYETGQGHPPAATLHRLAQVLGTTSSALLGEIDWPDDTEEYYHSFIKLFAEPDIGAVIRYMQDMTTPQRQSLRKVAAALRGDKPVETVETMR
jgi:hypothetical protein